MAFTFVAVQNGTITTSANMVVTKDAAVADGDFLFAIVLGRIANTITLPGGWTQIDAGNGSGGFTKTGWKVAAGEGASWSFAHNSSNGGAAIVIACRSSSGVDPTPIDFHTVKSNASGTNAPATGGTTTVDHDLLIFAGTIATGATITPATGYTEPSGGEVTLAGAYDVEVSYLLDFTPAGATGNPNATVSTAQATTTYLVAVKPVAGPTPIAGSDTGAAAGTEGTPAVALAGSDAGPAVGTEGTPAVALAAADTGPAAGTAGPLALALAGADTGAAAGTEGTPAVALTAADTGPAAGTGGPLTLALAAADAGPMAATEAGTTVQLTLVAGADTGPLGATEAGATVQAQAVAGSDAAPVGGAEAGAVGAVVVGTDAAPLGAAEAATTVQAFALAAADAAPLAAAETAAAVPVAPHVPGDVAFRPAATPVLLAVPGADRTAAFRPAAVAPLSFAADAETPVEAVAAGEPVLALTEGAA